MFLTKLQRTFAPIHAIEKRLLSLSTMSEVQKSATRPKQRVQSGNKGRASRARKQATPHQSANQKKAWNSKHLHTGNQKWPGDEYKCILLYQRDDSITISQLVAMVSPFGNVTETSRMYVNDGVMTMVELASAAEAETAWKTLSQGNRYGVRVMPDAQHTHITSSSAPYWDDDAITKGLEDGSLVQGSIRINPKVYHNAYISDGKNPDIFLDSMRARNRAMAGDVVAVKLRPSEEWIVSENSAHPVEDITNRVQDLNVAGESKPLSPTAARTVKTGDVVGIIEKRHNRICVGSLDQFRGDFVLFVPGDPAVPRLLIPKAECPTDYATRPGDYKNKLFMAKLLEWHEKDVYAWGQLCQIVGEKGEIEPETERILLEHGVDYAEFPITITESLPSDLPWKVPEVEYEKRRDLRSECVFTIDPSTARDLDDALHCKKIGDDLYEIGVHIADVSYFVKPRTEVDSVAAKRCTSVYLVQRVVPMLPRLLCEELCSLNPGQDRLTYSVIWKITGEGRIVGEWFGRTVIHSCVKMSYDHAQSFIDHPGDKELNKDEFPTIYGGHSLESIKSKVLVLHKISQLLRERRFDDGALRLDQIRLSYTLDENTGMPNSCFTYEYKASNELIEEYMLLANMAVAHKLNECLPEHAFLRCHPEPKEDMLKSLASYCAERGLPLNTSSSKDLAESIRSVLTDESLGEDCFLGLQMLAIKPQELAVYFCAGRVDDEENYRHYALNVPLYTHFTSPIRRYADVIVHRQLSAVLGDTTDVESANLSPEDLQKQADACNVRKSEAKKVQDLSVQLFFWALTKSVGCLESEAVVLYVHDQSFDVLSTTYGQVYRVYLNSLPIVGSKQTNGDTELEIIWPCDGTDRYKLTPHEMKLAKNGQLKMPKYSDTITQTIKVFTTVKVVFEPGPQPLQVRAFIRRQSDQETNSVP